MSAAEKVTLVEVVAAPALEVVVKTREGEQLSVALAGIAPAADDARDELENTLQSAKGLRVVREGAGKGFIEYLARQDKSGAIWVDAGRELVSLGLAVTDGSKFSRATEYADTQRQAKEDVSPRYPVG